MSPRTPDGTIPPHQLHAAALACPVCGAALQAVNRTLRCVGGHTYDVAREGYVDLLPAGHGRSRRHGDTADMARARVRFLDRGHYDPLVQVVLAAVVGALAERSAGMGAPVILDAGCGTGHYVGALARQLHVDSTVPAPHDGAAAEAGRATCAERNVPPRPHLLGADISRDALRIAARRHRDILFFVNDVTHRLSVPAASVDVLLDVFAPRNAAEFGRVVRPGGALIVVVPSPDHHHELRERLRLLDIPADKEERTGEALADDFELEHRDVLRYSVDLSADDVKDLVAMSPSAWHVDAAEVSAGLDGARSAGGTFETTLGFVLLRFTRRRGAQNDS